MSHGESVPLPELTEDSFVRAPVWQFGLEEEGTGDESRAFPATDTIRLGIYGSFMVRALYRLRNGEQFPGAVQVDLLNHKAIFTPAFLYVGGKSLDPLAQDIGTRMARITKQTDCQPTHWTLGITIPGDKRPRSGRIAQSRVMQALGLLARLVLLKLYRGRAR